MKNTSRVVRLRVSDILKERDMSVVDFQRATGLAYNTAGALARGHFERIGLDTIQAICNGLDVTPSDLFSYTPEASTAE